MATYYVGPGGNNANSGLSWALRKLTLAGAEAVVAAGDTVYVGPGTYREQLTCTISGTLGNPITYIGDYFGHFTDGIGGLVRITASDDDETYQQRDGFDLGGFNYRSFIGFSVDVSDSNDPAWQHGCFRVSSVIGAVVNNCYMFNGFRGVLHHATDGFVPGFEVSNCYFDGTIVGISFVDSANLVNNAAIDIYNCIFNNMGRTIARGILITRIGGAVVRNCSFIALNNGIRSNVALTASQTITVNNSMFEKCQVALYGVTGHAGNIAENYNNFWDCTADRTDVNTGANSINLPPYRDPRFFFRLVDNFRLVTPFDLAEYCQFINLPGVSPPAHDMRGTGTIGAHRDWGPLEYDPTLLTASGGIPRSRLIGGV